MPVVNAAGNYHTQNAERFATAIGEATGGAIEVVVHPSGSLYKGDEIKRAVQTGQAQLGERLISSLGNEHALFELDSLPFLATSFEQARKLYTASRPALDALLESQNLKLLYAVPWPPQGLITTKPEASAADMKGVKFRAYNAAPSRLADFMGAQPTQIEALDDLGGGREIGQQGRRVVERQGAGEGGRFPGRTVALEADEADARDRAQPGEEAGRDGASGVGPMAQIAGPDQPDAPLTSCRGQRGRRQIIRRMQIGHRGRHAVDRGAEQPAEAHQRCAAIDLGQGVRAPEDQFGNPVQAFGERRQRRGNLEHDLVAPLGDQGGVAQELDCVADALFGMEQDAPTFEWPAVPQELRIAPGFAQEGAGAPAPFIGRPAGKKIAAQKAYDAELHTGGGMCGPAWPRSRARSPPGPRRSCPDRKARCRDC